MNAFLHEWSLIATFPSMWQLPLEMTTIYTCIVSTCSSPEPVTAFLPFLLTLEADSRVLTKLCRKHAESFLLVRVRPQCVVFSSESGYLSCSFDDGLCGWIRDKDGDLHWETTPDPSGNWKAAGRGVSTFVTHTHKSSGYFLVRKWKWE